MTTHTLADRIARFLASQIVKTSSTKTHTVRTDHSSNVRALIHGDNLDVFQRFGHDLVGAIDLIYIDPPFATSNEFRVGASAGSTMSAPKDWALAYSDAFTLDGYLKFLKPRITAARDTLSDLGSFYIHTDIKVGHYVKVLMDEIFGKENFRNEITRIKCNPKNFERRGFREYQRYDPFLHQGEGLHLERARVLNQI